jgi:hypothetical protein
MDEAEFDLENELADEERCHAEMMNQLYGEELDDMEFQEESKPIEAALLTVAQAPQTISKDLNDENSMMRIKDQPTPPAVLEALNQEYFQSRNKIPIEKYKSTLRPSSVEQRAGGGPSASSSHSFLAYSSPVTQAPPYHSVPSIKYLQDRPLLGAECESVTLPNGKRKYIYYRKISEGNGSYFSLRDSLLSRPIEEILKEAERNKITRLASSSSLDASSSLPSSNESTDAVASPMKQQGSTLLSKAHQLWVDKYSPKSFPQVPLPPPLPPSPPPLSLSVPLSLFCSLLS